MKKRLTVFLFGTICTFSLVLSACGKKSEETIQEEPPVSSENIEQAEETELPTQTPLPEEPVEEADTHTGIHPLHIMTGGSYDSYWDETINKNMANITYPTIWLEDCCAREYPELAQALTGLSADRKKDIIAEFDYLIEQSAIQLQETGEEYFQAYESSEIASVRRADANIVSILMECYYYGGGVHGMPYDWGYTYDAKTGQELSLSDVVNDISVLPQLIQTELDKYYEPEIFFEDMDLNSYFSEYLDSVSWVLDSTGLTFIFNPYDLAPYAAGSQAVTLSFAEYPNLVKSEYQQVPKKYAVDLPVTDSFYYDVDGDGTKDELAVFGIWDEYGDRINKHCIIIDGRRFEVETDSYELDPYLIHMAGDQNYLYIQDSTDNDYRYLNVYKFTPDGAVEYVGLLDNAGWYSEHIETDEYMWLQHVLTDPDQFRLEGRTDVLSTLMGYKHYQISDNGMPVTEDRWFTHTSEVDLTLLQTLDVDVVDDATGEKTGTMTLQAGTEVVYYRTDDRTFADLKLSDGTVVRVMINMDGWPRTVGEMEIESVFEGMMFAG